MSAVTGIEWTDKTWNPTRGCSIVSPGCVNCYAMKQAHRFSGAGKAYEGLTKLTDRSGPQWTGKVVTVESALFEPLSWRKPAKVFVNSMSDLFHEDVPDAFIDRVFAVMALAERHTFQVLTKRPQRMRDYLLTLTGSVERMDDLEDAAVEVGDSTCAAGAFEDRGWPLPNVWLGTSVENQHFADERIPLLLQTPAAVRFISAEPLLGPVDLSSPVLQADCDGYLDWVIVGGESGASARPCALEWIESIVSQCEAAQVSCFVKQLGAYVVSEERTAPADCFSNPSSDKLVRAADGQFFAWRMGLKDRKGGDSSEWLSAYPRQFPEVRA